MKKADILIINPGSTSTKIAVYKEKNKIFEETINHSPGDLSKFSDIIAQYEYRKSHILDTLKKKEIDILSLKIIMGRGGLLRPIPSGVYTINNKMIEDLKKGALATQHASNLGGMIADEISKGIPNSTAYIADPPVVDEMIEVASIVGHPRFKRKPIYHALNQKAVARRYALEVENPYESLKIIVAHLGGGISVGAHKDGKIIDVNNALDGEGPFSPERSGTIPAGDLAKLCFSGNFTLSEIKKMLVGNGGVKAHLGTSDMKEVEKQINEGNKKSSLILDALVYQVAKSIGALHISLYCKTDAIIITGGLAHSSMIVDKLKEYITPIAPITIYPGENELESLALNGWLILSKQLTPLEY